MHTLQTILPSLPHSGARRYTGAVQFRLPITRDGRFSFMLLYDATLDIANSCYSRLSMMLPFRLYVFPLMGAF